MLRALGAWRCPNKKQPATSTGCLWRVSPRQHAILLARDSQISCQHMNDFSKLGFVGLFTLSHHVSVLPCVQESLVIVSNLFWFLQHVRKYKIRAKTQTAAGNSCKGPFLAVVEKVYGAHVNQLLILLISNRSSMLHSRHFPDVCQDFVALLIITPAAIWQVPSTSHACNCQRC